MSVLNLPTTYVPAIRRTACGLTLTLLFTAAATVFATAGQPDTAPVLAQASPSPEPASGPNIYDGNWHVTVAPYIFGPNLNGTLNYNLPRNPAGAKTLGIHIGPNDYLASLHFAFMGYAQVQKGDWNALADLIYMNLSSSAGSVVSVSGPRGRFSVPVTVGLDTTLNSTIVEFLAGRTVYHGSGGALNLDIGLRSASVNTSASWNLSGPNNLLSRSGSVSQSVSMTDFVIAAQGNVKLGRSSWSIPYDADYGFGSGNNTAQQWLGIAYEWRHGQKAFLLFRNLAYFGDGSKLIQVMRFTGPEIGYAFGI